MTQAVRRLMSAWLIGTLAWSAPAARAGGPGAKGLTAAPVPGGLRVEWHADGDAPQAALIALPPQAQPALEVLAVDYVDAAPPAESADAPLLALEPIGVVRGVALARLTFNPVHAAGGVARRAAMARAIVRFNAPAVPGAGRPDPRWARALSAAVINPEQIATAPRTTGPQASAGGAARMAVEVDRVGLTALSYAALAAAGFPMNADPAALRLTHAGVEVSMEWDGDGDPVFEPGERLLFFAQPRFSRYAARDVYWLDASGPGLRMASRAADPAGLPAGTATVERLVETNALYTPMCYCGRLPPGRDTDRWTWDVLRQPDRVLATYPFQLPAVDAGQPATLTVWLIGYTDPPANPDHRVRAALNGTALGQVEWNGKIAVTATVPVSPGVLIDGSNVLSLTLPGVPGVFVEGAWLDAFQLSYARGGALVEDSALFIGQPGASAYTLALSTTLGVRAYDVTDPAQPVRLAEVVTSTQSIGLGDPAGGLPRRYALAAESAVLEPAALRLSGPYSAPVPGDYVMISPAAFLPALTPLAQLRVGEGRTVSVVDLQYVYDVFGDGRPAPQAVRAFLADAYFNWGTAPSDVLLVGDGTADPKRYRPDSATTYLPPFLADVDPWGGETAADNRFVTVDGPDALPDMLIGRLPVNTLTETQFVVGKIVDYAGPPGPGLWNGRAAFVSDNADGAGNFPAQSQSLAQTYAPWAEQIAIGGTQTITATRQAVRDRWNLGASLMMFTGHSSNHQWAAERLFHLDDVAGLANGARLPVVLEMTCFTANFHDPAQTALDEALVRHPAGGAVAAWGATGQGVATGHDALAAGFLRRALSEDEPSLGFAALAGKLEVAATRPAHLDLIDTYHLLGDPATQLVAPPAALYLPLIQR